MPDLANALQLKLKMFAIHYICCLLFFSLSALSSLVCLVALDRPDLSEVCTIVLELAAWTCIALTFKPRRGIAYFSLLQVCCCCCRGCC